MSDLAEDMDWVDVSYWIVCRHHKLGAAASFLTDDGCFGDRSEAVAFIDQLSAARQLRKSRQRDGVFEFIRIDERLGPFEPLPEAVWERVKDIPHPYAFAAADWLEGKDPKEGWLRYRSRSTYQRHRKRLLTYGIDIASTPPGRPAGEISCASAQNVLKLPHAD